VRVFPRCQVSSPD